MINLNFEAVTVLMPKIGADAFCLLIAISKHMDASRSCFPGRVLLMKLTGLKKDAYYKAMATLKEKGCLSAHQEPGKAGKFGRNIFKITAPYISVYAKLNGELEEEINTVSEIPEPCPKKPDAVMPDAVFSDTKHYQQKEVLPSNEVYVNIKNEPEKQNFEIWKDAVLQDQLYIERSCLAMRRQIQDCKITPREFSEYVNDFLNEIQLLENLPKDENQFRKYLYYWLPGWLKKLEAGKPKQFPQTHKAGQTIKTTGHIIRTQYDEDGNVIPRTKTSTI